MAHGQDLTGIELRQVRIDHPDAVVMIGHVQELYQALYGGPDETPIDAAEFEPPSGRFFVAYLDGDPVAMGGWRFRPDVSALGRATAAEIKRMYVDPAARRRGLARAMLVHLERSAAGDGADLAILETGDPQVEAIALYRSAGYEPVEGFGIYRDEPDAHYYGRRL